MLSHIQISHRLMLCAIRVLQRNVRPCQNTRNVKVVGFKILTVVVVKRDLFWGTVHCSWVKVSWCFRGICCLHFQAWMFRQARNSMKQAADRHMVTKPWNYSEIQGTLEANPLVRIGSVRTKADPIRDRRIVIRFELSEFQYRYGSMKSKKWCLPA